LVTLFNCSHQRMQCINSVRWILQEVVSAEGLEKTLGRYLNETYGGQESQLVAIDSKTMRGTIPKRSTQGVHLLAAYLPTEGLVLMQVEVGSKENEITAAPEVVKSVNLNNKVVCGDAMQTQRDLSVAILGQGGHYLWFLKENQPAVLDDVAQFLQPPHKSAGWPLPEQPVRSPGQQARSTDDWNATS